jgi:excisionase family DNA binding protein
MSPCIAAAERCFGEGGFGRLCDWVYMTYNSQHHPSAPDDALLDAAGVAELLGVPTSWVYAETRAGRLPHVRVGRYRRFRRRAVEEWIDAHQGGPCR